MGYYINKNAQGKPLPVSGKADMLLKDEGAVFIPNPTFQDNLICVVDNRIFEAAAFCYSEREFEEFARPDGRKKKWLTHPKAKELSDFTK